MGVSSPHGTVPDSEDVTGFDNWLNGGRVEEEEGVILLIANMSNSDRELDAKDEGVLQHRVGASRPPLSPTSADSVSNCQLG